MKGAFQVRTNLFHKYTTYEPFIVNAFVDYCDFRKGKHNPITGLVFAVIDKYTNISHECPFKPLEKFIIENLEIPTNGLPVVVPAGDYRLNIGFYKDANESLRYALIQVFARVRALISN